MLQFKAAKWIGTPFFPNSNTPGERGGVSCQKLASEIYAAAGFARIEVPEVAMAHARFSSESLVEPWLDARKEFQRLTDLDIWNLVAGDLLGFRLNRVVHHIGIYLGQRTFIHAMEGLGTSYAMLTDATWGSRLAAAWRTVPDWPTMP